LIVTFGETVYWNLDKSIKKIQQIQGLKYCSLIFAFSVLILKPLEKMFQNKTRATLPIKLGISNGIIVIKLWSCHLN
jgi:hypothetical protein